MAGGECGFMRERLTFFWVEGAGSPQLVKLVDELQLNRPDS